MFLSEGLRERVGFRGAQLGLLGEPFLELSERSECFPKWFGGCRELLLGVLQLLGDLVKLLVNLCLVRCNLTSLL